MLQAIAGGAFIALINMFFVSVYALLPSINIGLPAVILGVAADRERAIR
jgi:formate/nitrite transporter FocA (FNT family)